MLAVAVPAALVVTEVFHRLVERPSLVLARRAGGVPRVAPVRAHLAVAAHSR